MPLSKNTEKHIRSLAQKKFRQQHQQFLVEGDKIVRELLIAYPSKINLLVATEEWLTDHEQLVNSKVETIHAVTAPNLKKVSQLKTPNQVLAVVQQWSPKIDENVVKNDWSLYLDHIQDPGNFGTILRIANWFGIQHVFCSPNSVELYNPKVVQASMGALLRTQVLTIELTEWSSTFPDVPLYATSLSGSSIYAHDELKSGLLILGNESRGVSEKSLQLADQQLRIPSYGTNDMESLNVAVAAGILCAWMRRGN